MKLTPLYYVYKALDGVYRKGAFSSIELNKYIGNARKEDKALICKLFYGVLERDIESDYLINAYVVKVKPAVRTLLKIGIYEIKYMDIPDFAAVNECVKLAGDIGKPQIKGFVNAVLRRISEALSSGSVKYPTDEFERMSIEYSFPLWAVKRLISEMGKEKAEAFMSYRPDFESVNIRVNTRRISVKDFEKLLSEKRVGFRKTPVEGVYRISSDGLSFAERGYCSIMGMGSVLACRCVKLPEGASVFDACAAPGGKSVYLAEMLEGEVTACELYPHRAELIRKYAEKAGVKVNVEVGDASVFEERYKEKFDFVLCDVPCSGYGVVFSKPDIKLNRKEGAVEELARLQYGILKNCAEYVKEGGVLVYSTCTVFDRENGDQIRDFLASDQRFRRIGVMLPEEFSGSIDEYGQAFLFPGEGAEEGFFIAAMEKLREK